MKNIKKWELLTDEEKKNLSYDEKEKLQLNYNIRKGVKISVISFIILFLIVTIFNTLTTVPTGFVGVKTRFGQVQNDVIQEGLNVKVPYIEQIVRIDCKTKKIQTTSESSTKDMQTVQTTVAVNYNVNKETANKIYKEIGLDYEDIIINPAILESIKSAMAQYTAEELITKRAEVSNKIQETLIDKIKTRGFIVTEFNLTNIDFSEEYDRAIEAKAVKQQEVVTAQAELEKQKIQNEKEISIAEKDAKVMQLQNQQITDKTLQLKALEIQQKLIEKWDGKFPSTMLGESANMLFNINK